MEVKQLWSVASELPLCSTSTYMYYWIFSGDALMEIVFSPFEVMMMIFFFWSKCFYVFVVSAHIVFGYIGDTLT